MPEWFQGTRWWEALQMIGYLGGVGTLLYQVAQVKTKVEDYHEPIRTATREARRSLDKALDAAIEDLRREGSKIAGELSDAAQALRLDAWSVLVEAREFGESARRDDGEVGQAPGRDADAGEGGE